MNTLKHVATITSLAIATASCQPHAGAKKMTLNDRTYYAASMAGVAGAGLKALSGSASVPSADVAVIVSAVKHHACERVDGGKTVREEVAAEVDTVKPYDPETASRFQDALDSAPAC